MPRGNQVTRQWRLIQLLERSRRGLTFEELARELDCTTRTIMRDLDYIQAVDFPETKDRDGKEKHWKFVEGYRCNLPVPLSLWELMALYFTRSLLSPLHGTPFHSALESAIAKIRALLPPGGHGFHREDRGARLDGGRPSGTVAGNDMSHFVPSLAQPYLPPSPAPGGGPGWGSLILGNSPGFSPIAVTGDSYAD